MHCSPFGSIPKKQKPGKWRLIIDLSVPEGSGVNDGIAKKLCSLAYTSVDEVVPSIIKLGKGSLLAKMTLKQAYQTFCPSTRSPATQNGVAGRRLH